MVRQKWTRKNEKAAVQMPLSLLPVASVFGKSSKKKLTQAEYLPIEKLKPFEGNPFYVKDDNDMEQLKESIRQQGVLNPIRVRPLDTGEYEVIAGHRRLHPCKKAGIEMIPAFVCSMDRNDAGNRDRIKGTAAAPCPNT